MVFTPDTLAALTTPGVSERWQAVQERLHPELSRLAEQIAVAASERMVRQWPLYELSYKGQRAIHRGYGRRDPISDYWLAYDRPPRGAGVLVAVSGSERAILVGLQLWGVRKPALARVWDSARPVWSPLIERIGLVGQARFVGRPATPGSTAAAWIEHYLTNPRAGYLWAGFVYPWADLPADLDERIVADLLALLPLNEALMEQVELQEPPGTTLLREHPAAYMLTGSHAIEAIAHYVRVRGLTMSELNLRAYHIALQTRPLVILAGISGTGKTRLTRLYADAVYTLTASQDNPYYLLVAVQPDWHNARDLLGYYNALQGQFHASAFLRFLLQAAADPQHTYYVCLDELNLARPEHYLAPILSAMETTEGLIDLATPRDEVPLSGGGTLRNPIRLPLNLRLIGTVNVDESSFPLSDKLLDRANLIELTDVDLATFRVAYPTPIDDALWSTIVTVHAAVSGAGHPFGYRVLGEMLRFIEQARGTLTPTQALDLQLKQRVLPRLRGEEGPRLRRALSELLCVMLGLPAMVWTRASLVTNEQIAAAPYPESATRLRRMLERLDQDGFTDFYA